MIYRKDGNTDSVIHSLRNMLEFAVLGQFLCLFYKILKLDDFDIEFFEQELLGFHEPRTLTIIRYGLVRYLSSNRHINAENVDFYTRKQFLLRKPEDNPYGNEEIPYSWDSFDIFTKVHVLLQLCEWQLLNPEKFRERVGARESDEISWRIDPIGRDSVGYTYYLLDDNRLYRCLHTLLYSPNEKLHENDKRYRRKRKRIVDDDDVDSLEDSPIDDKKPQIGHWENVCVTFNDWKNFVDSISHSRNKNEYILHNYLQKNILPYLQENEDKKEKERQLKERERLKAEALIHRKKSTRIEQKKLMKLQEEKRLKQEQLAMLIEERKKEEKQSNEYSRGSRIETRDRKQKEKLLKEFLKKEDNQENDISNFNHSYSNLLKSRQTIRKSTKKVKRKAIENKKTENNDWIFDCICGIFGKNYSDDELMISCDKCMVWEHVKCQHNAHEIYLDLQKQTNEDNCVPFICNKCDRKLENAEQNSKNEPEENKITMPETLLSKISNKMIVSTSTEKTPSNSNISTINEYISKIHSNVHDISESFDVDNYSQTQISYSQITNLSTLQRNEIQSFKPFYSLEPTLHIQNISSSLEDFS
ncbi:hypothetical protein MERGE_000801 [Pneumocystis wakefieldiae]|uniref:Zinc finger PHD-type domain-containing protein n=1 Tax=Pneumocystis wakefieldiae TaxID=38082 RepID=A0A899FX96_9ASCO|nr:hypothetical protein MERGE_000801 [Pneumocystis wakefieldiae]